MTVFEALERSAGRGPRAMALLLAATLAVPVTACGFARAEPAVALEERRAATVSEYQRLLEEATLSERRLAELAAEIAAVRKDKASVSTALIQAAKTERKLAEDIEDIEARLVGLREHEEAIRLSLKARRGVLAEVLGALQRMGLNPPPAILVKPEDALSSVRSAIVLGAVVPELRAETEILIGDLREMRALRIAIDEERERLFATVRDQAAEKQRLTLLLQERERLLQDSESTQVAEARRAAELAAKAGDLKELIASIETEIESVREAVEAARRAEEDRARREAEAIGEPVPEQYRLLDRPPFQSLAGQVSLPVSGRIVRRFGEGDGIGGHAQGDTVQTQSGSIVTSPADAGILYAGPFRSYGQLLILDAGGGYHVVLAGLGRISVSLGQSVLAGEPVGSMGEARLASIVALGGEGASPELYVEFRKDGKPVDPAPWWSERSSGRTGNDT